MPGARPQPRVQCRMHTFLKNGRSSFGTRVDAADRAKSYSTSTGPPPRGTNQDKSQIRVIAPVQPHVSHFRSERQNRTVITDTEPGAIQPSPDASDGANGSATANRSD